MIFLNLPPRIYSRAAKLLSYVILVGGAVGIIWQIAAFAKTARGFIAFDKNLGDKATLFLILCIFALIFAVVLSVTALKYARDTFDNIPVKPNVNPKTDPIIKFAVRFEDIILLSFTGFGIAFGVVFCLVFKDIAWYVNLFLSKDDKLGVVAFTLPFVVILIFTLLNAILFKAYMHSIKYTAR
jgi:hypothetical protein